MLIIYILQLDTTMFVLIIKYHDIHLLYIIIIIIIIIISVFPNFLLSMSPPAPQHVLRFGLTPLTHPRRRGVVGSWTLVVPNTVIYPASLPTIWVTLKDIKPGSTLHTFGILWDPFSRRSGTLISEVTCSRVTSTNSKWSVMACASPEIPEFHRVKSTQN